MSLRLDRLSLRSALLLMLLAPAVASAQQQTIYSDKAIFTASGPTIELTNTSNPYITWADEAGQQRWALAQSGAVSDNDFIIFDIVNGWTVLRVDADANQVLVSTLTSASNLNIASAGNVLLNPTGNGVLPTTGYDLNLGSLQYKFLTLHAAELWVETLVAQNTMATIGGRILVGPTTTLTSDLAPAATSMSVKHNNLANGDRVYLESDGSVEFIAVASAPSGVGPYTYTITRNLDGSGANQWYAGDAIFNTGQTGNGFIDLYSVRGVNPASTQSGPTIVGNVRLSSTYNDWSPRWAVGNLYNLYGYGTNNIYGLAAGDPAGANVTVDATNGIRLRDGTSNRMVLTTSALSFYDDTNRRKATFGTDALTIGHDLDSSSYPALTASQYGIIVASDAANYLQATATGLWGLYNGATKLRIDTSGNITLGEVANNNDRLYLSGGALYFVHRDGSGVDSNRVTLQSDGTLQLGEIANSRPRFQVNNVAASGIYRDGVGVDHTMFYLDTGTGSLRIGETGASKPNVLVSSTGIDLRLDTTTKVSLASSGSITVGETGTNQSNVTIVSDAVKLRTGTSDKITLGTNGTISLTGSLSVGTTGAIYSGQTAYNTGTGWWLEYNSGTPRMSIGDGTGARLLWTGSDVELIGSNLRIDAGSNHVILGGTAHNSGGLRFGTVPADPSSSNTYAGVTAGSDQLVLVAGSSGVFVEAGVNDFVFTTDGLWPNGQGGGSLGKSDRQWSEAYIDMASTTDSLYPVVLGVSNQLLQKTDGYNGQFSFTNGIECDFEGKNCVPTESCTVTVEYGIVVSLSCS